MSQPRKAWITVEIHDGIQWAMLHRTGSVRHAVPVPLKMRAFFRDLVKVFGKGKSIQMDSKK